MEERVPEGRERRRSGGGCAEPGSKLFPEKMPDGTLSATGLLYITHRSCDRLSHETWRHDTNRSTTQRPAQVQGNNANRSIKNITL